MCVCLCAFFMSQGVSAQLCPPEKLTVELKSREIAKNVQFSIFGNDSVVPYIQNYLKYWRGEDVDAVEVVNDPPRSNTARNNYYTYENSKNGVENYYRYTVGNKQYTCPVTVKVLDRYHPYCNGRKPEGYIPSIGEMILTGSCATTRELVDHLFDSYAQNKIFQCTEEYNDVVWSHQYEFAQSELRFAYGCERLVKEAWIDWDNTYKDWNQLNQGEMNLELEDGEKREIKFYYVFYDESGNKALTNYATPCIGRVIIKRTDFSDIDFSCPNYGTFFTGVETMLPFPIVSPEQYVKWLKATLHDANGSLVSTTVNIETNGIRIKMPETEGDYTLKVVGDVCGAKAAEHTVTCPIKLVEAKEHCIK